MKKCIHIEGAREHNLKNINIDIPRDEMVVVCGPSGSGKSTLAFDIVYAEGQRRYVESLSTYARQFLPQMDKPDVDKIEGLSPAISLEQQSATRNPRSTVGTVTEVYDFLRVFYARLGKMHCTKCGKVIAARAADEIIDDVLSLGDGTRCMVLAPLVEHQKGTQQDRLKKLKAQGFVRVRIDGVIYEIDQAPALEKNVRHNLDLVVEVEQIEVTPTDLCNQAQTQGVGLCSLCQQVATGRLGTVPQAAPEIDFPTGHEQTGTPAFGNLVIRGVRSRSTLPNAAKIET